MNKEVMKKKSQPKLDFIRCRVTAKQKECIVKIATKHNVTISQIIQESLERRFRQEGYK